MALLDFDVHHGNGTQACVARVVPHTVQYPLHTPLSDGHMTFPAFNPWVDDTDKDNILFARCGGFAATLSSRDVPASLTALARAALQRAGLRKEIARGEPLLPRLWSNVRHEGGGGAVAGARDESSRAAGLDKRQQLWGGACRGPRPGVCDRGGRAPLDLRPASCQRRHSWAR